MKNIELTKRALALLSASTIALTMGGCSNSSTNQNSSSSIISIVSEMDSSKDQDISSIISSIVSSSSKENESKDVTTEVENPSKVDDTSSRVQDTSSKEQTSSQTESKPQTSSSKPSNSSQSTTSKPSTTKVEKLTRSNINDVEAIETIAKSYSPGIYECESSGTFISLSYRYNGQIYYCEQNEFEFFIALFNEKMMSQQTLVELFEDNTLEDFQRYSRVFSGIGELVYNNNCVLNYDNFVVDPNLKKFLIDLQVKTKECLKTRNDDEYLQFIQPFYDGTHKYINHGDSALIDYFVISALGYVSKDTPNFDLFLLHCNNQMDSSSLIEYISSPTGFYLKTRSNQLTKKLQ